MNARFNRGYELVFGQDGQAVIVRPPFRVVFDINKSIDRGLNKATVRVYGLSETKRLKMVKNETDTNVYIPLQLSVGYGGALEVIYKGSVWTGRNDREGADFVTVLESQDGGFDFLNSYTSATVKGSNLALDTILETMTHTAKGKRADIPETIRPKVLVGNSATLLDTMLAGKSWFIDNETLHIIADGDVVSRLIPIVNARTGLLNTPSRELSKVTFATMMNPALRIGALCELQSKTAPHTNGVYKIQTINYTGDYAGTDWKQNVTAMLAPEYRVLA